MGNAPPIRPCSAPTHPFDKHGNRRPCIGAIVILSKKKVRYSSTLMQLILLRDWQRVLIRATMFPKEVEKPGIVQLYGVQWKLLPLHLACALQPPPKVITLLMTPDGAVSTPVRRRKKMKLLRYTWKFAQGSSSTEDQKELLTTRDELEEYPEDSIVSGASNKWECYKDADHHCLGSLVSLEQSVGGYGFRSQASTTMDGKDALEASICQFLGKSGVILQLTDHGGVFPMTVVQSQDTTTVTEETSSEFRKPLLMQAAMETKTLLPIHIACLYQASPAVLQILLQEYPMGALSAIMGMLPIHLIAAGWTIDPIDAAHPSSPLPLSMNIDDGTASDVPQAMGVLIQASPESSKVRSGCHGMSPNEYVEEHLEGSIKAQCMEILETCKLISRPSEDLEQPLDVRSQSSESENKEAVPSEIHCLDLSILDGDIDIQCESILYNLLLERDWERAIDYLEEDPTQAKEWYYGVEKLSDSNEPVLWKRTAMHLACTISAPMGLIDVLIHSYPNALGSPDPHNGAIPLHLACQYGSNLQTIRALIQARTATTKAVDAQGRLPLHYAILSKAPYSNIEFLVQHDPASVLCPDQHGKTPLQYAQRSYPQGSPVLGMLELVWM